VFEIAGEICRVSWLRPVAAVT